MSESKEDGNILASGESRMYNREKKGKGSGSVGQEYEKKFRATGQIHRQVRQAFPGRWQTIAMETTYYDTSDCRLSALRCTLRRRMENGVSVCTLKTPAKGGVRGEWEIQKDTIEDAVPELCKLAGWDTLSFLPGAPLVSICGARFTRHARTVHLQDCVAELALDDGVLIGGGKESPLCELEAELKEGSAEALDAFARELARKFSLEEEPVSKFRRALLLTEKQT